MLAEVVALQRPFAEDARCDLQLLPPASARLACSPGVLTSLLSNLIVNAVKYMGDSASRRIVVRTRERHALVRVEVEDTGPGIPPHLRETIFEPHVRGTATGVEGIGLGLATVKRLAQGHGGNAGVEPAPGGGSVFWFELPRFVDPPSPETSRGA